MEPLRALVQGKRITLLGLGLLGRGVGDAAFLSACGARVTVTDKKTEEELRESVERLSPHADIVFHLGGHVAGDFADTDMVIKAAGVPMDSPEIALARENDVPVYMSTALFAKYAADIGATIVGVTGTRGKSTTTHLIYYALCQTRDAGTVHLGGNVRGVSTLAMLPEIKKEDVVVLELDSWQLQGFGDLHISPHISIVTNLMPDHMNYYKDDMDRYFADKANIFSNQKEDDALFVGASVESRVRAMHPPVVPVVPDALPHGWNLAIPGEHNRENAALARAALRSLGVADADIRSAFGSFAGVEGRLQFVRQVRGVKIYNDNNATTPDATLAALRALSDGTRNMILIMGGADKHIDMSTLLYEIAGTCKRVIMLAGSGTDRIAPLMADYSVFDDMIAAVAEALRSAEAGDIILFSPAFASFGLFKNEYDRNDRFLAALEALAG